MATDVSKSRKLARKRAKAARRESRDRAQRTSPEQARRTHFCWVLAGTALESRPLTTFAPRSAPPRETRGRWVAMQDLRLGVAVLFSKGIVSKLPEGPNVGPEFEAFTRPRSELASSGWITAAELKPGDMLLGHDNQLQMVSNVADTGDSEPAR